MFGKQLDERSFQRRHLSLHCSIVELNLQIDRAKMRHPEKLLVRFEHLKLVGVALLNPEKAESNFPSVGDAGRPLGYALAELPWHGESIRL